MNNRRTAERFNHRKSCHIIFDGIRLNGMIMNISNSGICINTENRFHSSNRLLIEIPSLKELGIDAIECNVEIVHSVDSSTNQTTYCCKLTSINEHYLSFVEKVQKIHSGQGSRLFRSLLSSEKVA
ncbi:MAG: PilZ domain-containing protein [Thiotrichales bacterium]|nr:PilZ domain-containing protein [Thiotrichales bacterium]